MTEQKTSNADLIESSFLYSGNAHYIEQLYAQYETDPSSLTPEWREYFSNLADSQEIVVKNAQGASWQRSNWPIQPSDTIIAALDGDWTKVEQNLEKKISKDKGAPKDPTYIHKEIQKSIKALKLIETYRRYGHLKAKIDPLNIKNTRGHYEQLELKNFGLDDKDLNSEVYLDGALGFEKVTIVKLLNILQNKYCNSIGIEYMHISDPIQRLWIQEKIENNTFIASVEQKKDILQKLVEAEGFEQFLDAKYKGAKRFGLDGGESLIAGLNEMLKTASINGVEDVVFGMAHRGRLNVLSHILGKEHKAIFHEFRGGSYKSDDVKGSGDVKYHLGVSSDAIYLGNKVHLTLLPNPSHLEIVDPVVAGKSRAKQDLLMTKESIDYTLPENLTHRLRVLPVMLHGDAAFAGQGIVQEILASSGITGYNVAGSLHIVINNQVGFTTDPEFSRSTVYATDIAKMIDAPVFHVNGDDSEAVAFVISLALLYRQQFCKPVVVDLCCYRRFGHNEGDEPSFTQPLMYKVIRSHKPITEIYGNKLIAEKVIDESYLAKAKANWRIKLDEEFAASEDFVPKSDWLEGEWQGIKPTDGKEKVETGVELETLKNIAKHLVSIPESFNLHKTIRRYIDNRAKMLETGEGLDWATAEALAFGSLMKEGHSIRLSGEDVERGTFTQRHSVVYDQETKEKYTPLNTIPNIKAKYEPINSLLSEEGVLAYEYGYSIGRPNALTLWEAQFGDFANGAQVVFDQFISSAETKWIRLSGLVCLLPHGFEGQGPEHSSARLERFLQLCAENNMRVANCTTPANYFHILRRQIKGETRKPLIMMTPKSILRHKKAQSSFEELSLHTSFQPILLDGESSTLTADNKIRRVIICTGKVYYDLLEEREHRNIKDVYILRIEQLYPYPEQEIDKILSRFKDAEMYWCQEEPKNMGAWSYIDEHLEDSLISIGAKQSRAKYIGRCAAASPAVGLASEHQKQLKAFLEAALV